MVRYELYNTRPIKFIKILFLIIFSFFVTSILLVFSLRIDDTVSFNSGNIYSDNPKIEISSPSEVKLLSLNVKEGDCVVKGDTLFKLENKKIISDYNTSNLDIETNNEKITFFQKIILNLNEKKKTFEDLIKIKQKIYENDVVNSEKEIKTFLSKIELSNQQTEIISYKFKADSILFNNGTISKFDFMTSKNKIIENRKKTVENNLNYIQKVNNLKKIKNKYAENSNNLKRNIIEIENQITENQKKIVELTSNSQNKKINLSHISEELNRLYVKSPIDGTVSNLFNTKSNIDIIPKGESLITISPKSENYYAKITLLEKDLIYVKKGQKVNLKVDAYNYYKYGAIKGNISYISPSDIKGQFYCLVSLISYDPFIKLKAGYKFKGEIIINEMKLYEYLFKMIFSKLDRY